MKIIKQSAVQDHCQDCSSGQNPSAQHTLLAELGQALNADRDLHCSNSSAAPLMLRDTFFHLSLRNKESSKKGCLRFLEATKKCERSLCCINYHKAFCFFGMRGRYFQHKPFRTFCLE